MGEFHFRTVLPVSLHRAQGGGSRRILHRLPPWGALACFPQHCWNLSSGHFWLQGDTHGNVCRTCTGLGMGHGEDTVSFVLRCFCAPVLEVVAVLSDPVAGRESCLFPCLFVGLSHRVPKQLKAVQKEPYVG